MNDNSNDTILIVIFIQFSPSRSLSSLSISFQEGGVKRAGRKQAKGKLFHLVLIGRFWFNFFSSGSYWSIMVYIGLYCFIFSYLFVFVFIVLTVSHPPPILSLARVYGFPKCYAYVNIS